MAKFINVIRAGFLSLKHYIPYSSPEVYAVNDFSKTPKIVDPNSIPDVGDESREDAREDTEQSGLLSTTNKTTNIDLLNDYNPLTQLWLWHRTTWAHYRRLELVLVDEDGNVLTSNGEPDGEPLVNVGFGTNDRITIERINARILAEAKKGRSVFLAERPIDISFLGVNTFEDASDKVGVGGNGGITLVINLTTYIFAPIVALEAVFATMTFQAAIRMHFNWNEIANANNINHNKAIKTLINTLIFFVGITGLTLTVGAHFGLAVAATEFLLLAPVAITGYRALQHSWGALYNLVFMIKSWNDPLEWTRYRKQFAKKGLQALEAWAVFFTTAVIVGAIHFFAPVTDPAFAIGIVVGTTSVKAFTTLREYWPFQNIINWMFPGEAAQREKLNNETLSEKVKRFAVNPESDKIIKGKGFWGFFGFGSYKLRRKKFYHLAGFNVELGATKRQEAKNITEIKKDRTSLEELENQDISNCQRNAQATALILLLKSEQGIEIKMQDYQQKYPNSYNNNAKYQYLERVSGILFEREDAKNPPPFRSLSSKLKDAREILATIRQKEIQLKIAVLKDPYNSKIKEDLKTQEESVKKAKENLEFYENQFNNYNDPVSKFAECYNPADFESLFKVDPYLKLEVFYSLRKISHCESFHQAWVEYTRLYSTPLSNHLVTKDKNTETFINVLFESGKNGTVTEENFGNIKSDSHQDTGTLNSANAIPSPSGVDAIFESSPEVTNKRKSNNPNAAPNKPTRHGDNPNVLYSLGRSAFNSNQTSANTPVSTLAK